MASNAMSSLPDTAPRWHAWARFLLAGPGVAGLSLLVLAAMPLWFPSGAAGIDHLALPLVLLPAVWGLLFFHALLDRSLARVALVALLLAGLNGGLLARHVAAAPSDAPPLQERTP